MFNFIPGSAPLTTQLCDPQTLHAAWRKVRANKGAPGSDGVTIQQFEAESSKHLRRLARELAEERYYPLPVQKFTVKKPNGGTRELSVLTLKDRIVQRAVCDLLTPVYESKFLECSFGFRPNRGVPHAVARVAAIRAEGYEWGVRADIKRFFDTMDSLILMRFLRASIKEPSILRLIQMWLDLGGIMQPPKPPAWSADIENTVRYVGVGVEQLVSQLFHRAPNLDGYGKYRSAPIAAEWLDDETEFAKTTDPWSQAKREALINVGRDGLLLLLANSKGILKSVAAKNLLVMAPIAAGALAAPTVVRLVKDHLDRPRKIGIIQGSPLSPLLANIYLHSFDKAMTRAGIRMVRYADDLILLCRSEGRAKHALSHAQKRLATLNLQLNPKKIQIARFNDGIGFLGHVFDQDGCYQPPSDSRRKALQDGMQRTLKRGATYVSRSGRHVAQRGERVAAHIGARWQERHVDRT